MARRSENIAGAIVGAVALCALIPVSVTLRGYVLSTFWGWFVVASFPDIGSLSVPAAIGIATMIQLITYRHGLAREKDDDASIGGLVAKGAGVAVVLPLFTLFFGWIVKGFM